MIRHPDALRHAALLTRDNGYSRIREQWDYLTIAMKLPHVISLLTKDRGKRPTELELSSATGLARGQIRRCKLLIDLPQKYKEMLLEELKQPKPKQRLSEDLFIEIERALKTVGRVMPSVLRDKDSAREILIAKYKGGVIGNIVDLRKVATIARAEQVGADGAAAEKAIRRLVTDPTYSITQAFSDTVSARLLPIFRRDRQHSIDK